MLLLCILFILANLVHKKSIGGFLDQYLTNSKEEVKVCWQNVQTSCLIRMWNWLDILKISSDNVQWATLISSTVKRIEYFLSVHAIGVKCSSMGHFGLVANYSAPLSMCYMLITLSLTATFPGVYGQTIFQQQQLQRQPQKEGTCE